LPIYVVSGTERTGTSMMMYALIKGGIEGSYYFPNARPHKFNPNGLYEFTGYTLPNMLKSENKVIKVFGKKLIKVNHYFETKLKIVYMVRNPEESFISHKLMDPHYTHKRIKQEINKNLLARREKEENEIIEKLKKRKDILTFNVFDYNEVVKDPVTTFTQLKECGWNINIDECVKTINPEYCHSQQYQNFYNDRNNK
jgi:hypothetical protein